jgi:hypothetical protein
MVSRVRTINFLPDIFRTTPNEQFLSATLDQLVSQPNMMKIQGYIGSKFGYGVKSSDGYVVEPSKIRKDYQLEPSVVFLKKNTSTAVDALTYPGLVDALKLEGGETAHHNDLFANQFYSWDSFVDLDKVINYSQYYWLPLGPELVPVSTNDVYNKTDFIMASDANAIKVTANNLIIRGDNPTITLLRGGTYRFSIDQTSKIWIQGAPGTRGTDLVHSNLSTRDIDGLTNNGISKGVMTFNVPLSNSQVAGSYPSTQTVDLLTTLGWDDVNGKRLSELGSIDGVNSLQGRTLVFYGQSPKAKGYVGEFYDDNEFSLPPYEVGYYSDINKTIYYIDYTGDPVDPVIRLLSKQTIIQYDRIRVQYGDKYSYSEVYTDDVSNMYMVPYLSSLLDTLYYQDESNPARVGIIKLVSKVVDTKINVDTDILGRTSYTSPNGVKFTNGLKVTFSGNIYPESYIGNEYYVEGVGTSIKLLPVPDFIVPEPYGQAFYNPWDVSPADTQPYDSSINIPMTKDYLTINRSSVDKNAWTRSNRWFHIDVLRATAEYRGNLAPVVLEALNNPEYRAKRPIIEFYPNLKLYKQGAVSKGPIDYIDSTVTDPFGYIAGVPNCAGKATFVPTGETDTIPDGVKIVFTNATDPDIRNKIYIANYVSVTGSSVPVITLSLAPNGLVSSNQQVVVIRGKLEGQTYYFDGEAWHIGQYKQRPNQAPMFDILDSNNISLGDQDYYLGSSFNGCTLFQYAVGTGNDDPVLGFPVKYSSIANIGDITFNVSLNSDTFDYVEALNPITKSVDIGYVWQYDYATGEYKRNVGWQTAIGESFQYQVFEFKYVNDTTFFCDIPYKDPTSTPWQVTQVYVNNTRLSANDYVRSVNDKNQTVIKLNNVPPVGTPIEVLVYSDMASNIGYYQVPSNLQNNPFNESIKDINSGDIRGHFKSICNNVTRLEGPAFGANNYRDLGNVIPYGTRIIQSSASLVPAAAFLRNQDYSIFNSLNYNGTEYTKFKTLLIDTINRTEYNRLYSDSYILNDALAQIAAAKTNSNAFFWSDMLPSGNVYASNSYSFVNFIKQTEFPLTRIYNFTTANYFGVLVYVKRTENDGVTYTTQLIRGTDYDVSPDQPKVIVYFDLLPNDTIVVEEYNQTYGSFIPSTPTKMGLYPSSTPQVVYDETYVTPTYFIKGHDGSFTKLYGKYENGHLEDYRDRALLEFEKRIFNNLKLSNVIPLVYDDVFPGYSRTTDYTPEQIQRIYSYGFLNWVGKNHIDYKNHYFDVTNQFTYNFDGAINKINYEPITQGNWRGIYMWLYDTSTPHITPWEMLGYTDQPTWWEKRYGAGPYTSDNTLLWTDMSTGYNWNNGDPTIIKSRIRPDLLRMLPVDSYGNLVKPTDSYVSSYEDSNIDRPWKVGDMGPSEFAYRHSSAWPFDLMRIFALTKPAKFFTLGLNVDAYEYDFEFNQYLENARSRTPLTGLPIYGAGTATHSYLNWVVDYVQQIGMPGHDKIKDLLTNLDVRLAYRLAGFSDKDLLKFYVEKGSPNSKNSSLLIPDESYGVLLYDNQPFTALVYSSVIIQKSERGYRVYGNSQSNAFFRTMTPKLNGNYNKTLVGDVSVQVSKDFTTDIQVVPYGTEYHSVQALCEFLINYGRFLEKDGMVFDHIEGGTTLNWDQMVAETMYWAQSGWEVGSTVNVNPAATTLKINKENGIVQPLTLHQQNYVLNQNLIPIQIKDMNVYRNGTEFVINTLQSDQTFSYMTANISNMEHCIIFDNITAFNDVIYNLTTGLRQQRVLLKGVKSAEWNGQVDIQGFILNQDNVKDWQENVKYTKGVIVKYQNAYYTSTQLIQPSAKFNNSEWVKTEYESIQKGLLPNPSSRSYESTLYYDTHNANLENDSDMLGFSLIGYRPRDYLAAANLDDVTQVNVFLNMIRSMGTMSGANNLKNVTVPQGKLGYDIYENWAIKTGEFGGVLNSNFVEFKLNENQLKGNPGIVAITDGYNTIPVSQQVDLYSITNYGQLKSSVDILPALADESMNKLPDAGYVNFNDVKIHSYDVTCLNCISDVSVSIDKLYKTDYVWLADYRGQWNVFTPVILGYNTATSTLLVSVSNNLNNSVTLTFDKAHGLAKNDIIGVLNYSAAVDGYYVVSSIVDAMSLVVELTIPPTALTTYGQGIVFKLESVRVPSPKDATGTPTLSYEFDRTRVWADQDANGKWAVYEKDIRYDLQPFLKPPFTQSFGSGSTFIDGFGYLVGDAADGKVFVYEYSVLTNQYVLTDTIEHGGNFGSTIEKGTDTVVITDASIGTVRIYKLVTTTNVKNLVLEQTLTVDPTFFYSPGPGTGHSVAVSTDDRWIYISDHTRNRVLVQQLDHDYKYTDTTTTTSGAIAKNANEFFVNGNQTSLYIPGIRITFETSIFAAIIPDNYTVITSKYDAVTNKTKISLLSNVKKLIPTNTSVYRATVNYSATGFITVPDSLEGDNFGYRVSTNHDGSTAFVSAPNRAYEGEYVNWEPDTEYSSGTILKYTNLIDNAVTYVQCLSTVPAETNFEDIGSTLYRGLSGIGYTYAFERLSQTWEQSYDAKAFITGYLELFWIASSVLPTPMAFLNGRQLIEASDYDVLLDTVLVFITLNAGDILTLTGNKFIHKQTLNYYTELGSAQNGSASGIGVDCNLLGNEVMVGVPFLVNNQNGREGAVYRFTDSGKLYGKIEGTTVANVSVPTEILINGYEITVSGNASTIATQINNQVITNVYALAENDKLTIGLRDINLNPVGNRLTVSVLNKNTLAQMGLVPYTNTQKIEELYNDTRSQFGSNIRFNEHNSFVVSAPVSKRREIVRFDYTNDNIENDTLFDNNFTQFVDQRPNAGALYIYDYLPNYNETITSPGMYVFGQSCNDTTVEYSYEPNYGESLYFGESQLLVGTPKFDPTNSNGRFLIYKNLENVPNWSVYRKGMAIVDTSKLQGVQLYNNTDNTTIETLDYLDPLHGRLLGSVRENIDIISGVDPAGYNPKNVATNVVWGTAQLGTIWLDISKMRFINCYQDDVVYNSEHWGEVFPGSDVAVYSWVESLDLPAFYSGAGTPYDLEKYSTSVTVSAAGNLVVTYYYWVRNTGTIFTKKNKTLADTVLETYITDPQNSGIAYFAAFSPSTYGLYNIRNYLSDTDTSLHIGFNTGDNQDVSHNEYKLIRDGFDIDFLPGLPSITNGYAEPTGLYDRMLDSLSGLDEKGASVPDRSLPKLMQRGVLSRPRQTLVLDRFEALDNYIGYANNVLSTFPIVESKSPTFLTKKGKINPSTRKPFYDTTTVWEYTDWWAEGYSSSTKTIIDVPKYYYLDSLDATEGMIVGVETNSEGKREVYVYQGNDWVRVGLQDGTIQFKDNMWDYAKNRIGFGENFYDTEPYDSFPAEETRNVVRAINEEIYTDDLIINRNKSLVLLFNYIQSENIESQNYLPWLTKTSFIDVSHTIRQLREYEKLQQDNVEFLYGYLNEIKPYHVVMKEFYFKYDGIDEYKGNITDFDLPATYNRTLEKFISPNLSFNTLFNDRDYLPNNSIWKTPEYRNWYSNYGLTITGQDNYNLGILKVQLGLLQDDILINNAFPFPAQGIIRIDQEYIAYTGIDRDYNKLTGVSRGIYNSQITVHGYNAYIYMDIPKAVVYDTARGYTEPPVITAYIDTTIYPAPRVPAKFRAIMQLDKVVGIEVIENGEGYAVTPELDIQPSLSVNFSNNTVNFIENTISIQSTALVTGDCLQFMVNSPIGLGGVQERGYYYIGLISSYGDESVIALYHSLREATKDTDRINIINIGPFEATLNLVPRASLVMGMDGTRTITPMLKFDRTAYRPMVTEWTEGNFYGSGLSITNASSSLELSEATAYASLPALNKNSSDRSLFTVNNVYFGGYFDVTAIQSGGTVYKRYDPNVSGFDTLSVQPVPLNASGYSVNGSSDPWNVIWIRATNFAGNWAEYAPPAGITLLGVLGSSNSLPTVGTNSDGDAYLAPDAITGYRRIWIYVKDGVNPEQWSSTVDNSCAILVTQASGGAVTATTAWGTPGTVGKGSLQGALFPIVDTREVGGKTIVQLDMIPSGLNIAQLKNLNLYFYQDYPAVRYDNSANGGAIIDIYRPKFTPVSVLNEYTIAVIDPGAIYQAGDKITIKGSLLGGADLLNDATISVTAVTSLDAIAAAVVTGVSVSNFKSFYVNPISSVDIEIYNDINLQIPTLFSAFNFVAGDKGFVNDPAIATAGPTFNYVSYVVYKNQIYKCKEDNNDKTFLYDKWEKVDKDFSLFNALDRIVGFYEPTMNMPGKNLSLLVDNITYPENRYYGNSFSPDEEFPIDIEMQGQSFYPANVDLRSVLFDGQYYIAVGDTPTTTVVLKSADGVTWNSSVVSNQTLKAKDIAYDGQAYVITTPNLTTPLLVSFDAENWFSSGKFTPYDELAFDNTRYDSTAINIANVSMYGDTYGNGKFVAVGQRYVYVSTDALAWDKSYDFGTNSQVLQSVIYVNIPFFNGFVAVGYGYQIVGTQSAATIFANNGLAITSIDGISWNTTSANAPKVPLYGVAADDVQIIAVGDTGQIFTSSNGANWVNVTSPVNKQLNDVVYANNIFVAVGNNGTIIRSTNGSTWTVSSSTVTTDLYAVNYDGTRFIAVGDNSTILFSDDAVTWTLVGSLSAKSPFYEIKGSDFQYGYAPEEMVAGVVSDNLSMYVRTRPSSTWNYETYGHTGFGMASKWFRPDQTLEMTFGDYMDIPATLSVYVVDEITHLGYRIYENTDVSPITNINHTYSVNWKTKKITLDTPLAIDEVVIVEVYSVGGGNQLARDNTDNVPLRTDSLTGNSEIYLNYSYDSTLYSLPACYLNGNRLEYLVDYYFASTPERTAKIVFMANYDQDTDYITYTVLGNTVTNTSPDQFGYSIPETEVFVADGTATVFPLDNEVYYDSPLDNTEKGIINNRTILEVNGLRKVTPDDITFEVIPNLAATVDTTTPGVYKFNTTTYPDLVNTKIGSLISFGVYTTKFVITGSNVDPTSPTTWIITTAQTIPYVDAGTNASISACVSFAVAPVTGDIVGVTTFNDVRQQSLVLDKDTGYTVNQLYYVDNSRTPVRIYLANPVPTGPWANGTAIRIDGLVGPEQLNNNVFYAKFVSNTVYSLYLDQTVTTPVRSNLISNYLNGGYAWEESQVFQVTQPSFRMTDATRTWVTINGERLSSERLRYNNNDRLSILAPIISTDLVCVTSMVPTATPDELVYSMSINKDRVPGVYRSNNNTSTWLTQDLLSIDNVIYVNDVSRSVDTIVQETTVKTINGKLYSNVQVDFEDVREVTVYNKNTLATLNPDSYGFFIFNTAPAVVFNDEVYDQDEVVITLRVGEIVVINGEKIRFNKVDYANNILSGLTRGIDGTGSRSIHAQYTPVYSLIPTNKLDMSYYNLLWDDVIYNQFGASVLSTTVGEFKFNLVTYPTMTNVRIGDLVTFSSDPTGTSYKITTSIADPSAPTLRWLIRIGNAPVVSIGDIATFTYVLSGNPLQMSNTPAANFLKSGTI